MADTVDIGAFSEWMRDFAATVHDNAHYLTELDAAIGDADHGSNLDRGMKAVVAALDAG
jgi:dihydroxyacetone kinase-like protein